MKFELFVCFVAGYLFHSWEYWVNEPIRKYWRKKCNYNCDKCQVWDCERHYCDYEKQKREEKNKKAN